MLPPFVTERLHGRGKRGTVPMSAEVDAWFGALDHPLKEAMMRVRRIILGTDRRITETIKWKSPTFVFEGNIASIDPRTKKHVNLLFHRGASLPGKHPHLEGGGDTVRYMRFADLEDVKANKSELETAIRAACELNVAGG
jgi:hypothetical protein